MSDEQTTETTEAAPEPGDNERGNPPSAFIEDEITKAMADAQAVEDAKQAKTIAELMGETTEEPEQAEETAEGEPTFDPSKVEEEAKPDEPEEAKANESEKEASERYALRRKRRRIEKREKELEEQRRQYEAARPLMEIQDLIRAGKLTEAANRMAGMAGTSPEKFYLQLTESHLTGDEAEQADTGKLTPAQVEKMVEERLRKAEEQRQQQQQGKFLHSRVEELASIGRHQSLQKRFPYLGALPEGKLVAEMQQAVEFAAGSPQYQHLLQDTVAFAEELNKLQQQELTETLRRLRDVDESTFRDILSTIGYGSSDKPDGAQPPASKKTKAPADASLRRTTITDDDTSDTGGATREMSDEEQLAALSRLFAG